jgi:hypothetical protein
MHSYSQEWRTLAIILGEARYSGSVCVCVCVSRCVLARTDRLHNPHPSGHDLHYVLRCDSCWSVPACGPDTGAEISYVYMTHTNWLHVCVGSQKPNVTAGIERKNPSNNTRSRWHLHLQEKTEAVRKYTAKLHGQWHIVISGSTVLVRTLAVSHLRFRNLVETLPRTPLDEWSARPNGLYLHRTTQYKNTKTNIHASSGIRNHDPSNRAATWTGAVTYPLH